MTEKEPSPNQNIAEKIKPVYEDAMAALRYLISEGSEEYGIDLNPILHPDDEYFDWACWASLGDEELVIPIAQLGAATHEADKVHLLPQIYDIDWEVGEKWQGMEQMERFHFLRYFAFDVRASNALEIDENLPGIHPVFYPNFDEIRTS